MLLMLLCSQIEDPRQPLHVVLRLLCSQIEDPPHSLHLLIALPHSRKHHRLESVVAFIHGSKNSALGPCGSVLVLRSQSCCAAGQR